MRPTCLPASAPTGRVVKQPYHLVEPSPWPIIGALGGFLTVTGIIVYAHYDKWWLLILGLLVVIGTAFMGWGDGIRESRTPGLHSPVVRLGLRYGMTLFIASEVMFFVGFFWAYFNFFLYPENVAGATTPMWPPAGVVTFAPFPLPFLN